jgi:hypothetical protein
VGHGMDEGFRVIDDVGDDRDDAVYFPSAVGKIFEKDRDVVIGVVVCVAAGARAEQHDPFDAVAVDLVECGAEALEDRVVDGGEHRGRLWRRDESGRTRTIAPAWRNWRHYHVASRAGPAVPCPPPSGSAGEPLSSYAEPRGSEETTR